jgi:hypothetical protein
VGAGRDQHRLDNSGLGGLRTGPPTSRTPRRCLAPTWWMLADAADSSAAFRRAMLTLGQQKVQS